VGSLQKILGLRKSTAYLEQVAEKCQEGVYVRSGSIFTCRVLFIDSVEDTPVTRVLAPRKMCVRRFCVGGVWDKA
jgi:hypothetical protein